MRGSSRGRKPRSLRHHTLDPQIEKDMRVRRIPTRDPGTGGRRRASAADGTIRTSPTRSTATARWRALDCAHAQPAHPVRRALDPCAAGAQHHHRGARAHRAALEHRRLLQRHPAHPRDGLAVRVHHVAAGQLGRAPHAGAAAGRRGRSHLRPAVRGPRGASSSPSRSRVGGSFKSLIDDLPTIQAQPARDAQAVADTAG